MRFALVSYFDVGTSYGIGDEVFAAAARKKPQEILQVGIRNTLGDGVELDLVKEHADLLEAWRRVACNLLSRKEMELGWSEECGLTEAAYIERLRAVIEACRVSRCSLTLYSVGTAVLWLEFWPFEDDEALPFMPHVLGCFEFAGYTTEISKRVFEVANATIKAALLPEKARAGDNLLIAISRRPDLVETTDSCGHKELNLFTSFTHLVLCVDRNDEARLEKFRAADREALMNQEIIDFEYHGQVYFDWATCLVVARDLADEDETPLQQIRRIEECICIAHSFLGACEAFERLMLDQIRVKVSEYVEKSGHRGDAQNLNRLRTLALALVNLTNFTYVAACAEDQKYFELFERHAKLRERNAAIQDRCDVLYSVQVADREDEEREREKRVGSILAFLAAITLISVFADSYNFLEGSVQYKLIPDILARAIALVGTLSMSVLLIVLAIRGLSRKCK